MSAKKPFKILMVGGGTAGHVEPALAVANELRKNRSELEIFFVGTKNGLENRLVPSQNFELKLIPSFQCLTDFENQSSLILMYRPHNLQYR